MPDIIIQPDGSLLIPRGDHDENQFFINLLSDIVCKDTREALDGFFEVSENSDQIFGSSGLCG